MPSIAKTIHKLGYALPVQYIDDRSNPVPGFAAGGKDVSEAYSEREYFVVDVVKVEKLPDAEPEECLIVLNRGRGLFEIHRRVPAPDGPEPDFLYPGQHICYMGVGPFYLKAI